MLGTSPIAHAYDAGGASAVQSALVAAGSLGAGVALARASSGLSLGADGATWQSATADAPRFHGVSRRLLAEGARTNVVQNPRGESVSSVPSRWSILAGAGLGFSVTTGTESGLPYVDVQISGTASGAAYRLSFEGTFPSAAPGQVWTGSVFARLVSGSLAGFGNPRLVLVERSNGSLLASNLGSGVAIGAPVQRLTCTATLSNASTNQIGFELQAQTTAGAAVSLVLRVSLPQLEQAAFASSPIAPPAGTIAASTRAAEVASFALSGAAAAQGTLVGTFLLPQAAPAGTNQGLLSVDDGTVNNRTGLRNPGGGLAILPVRVVSGVETAGSTAGTAPAGTPFKAALAWDSGGIAACVAGGAVQSIAGAPPTLSRILLGQGRADLSSPLFGEIGPLDLYSARLADSSLQALTSG